MVIIVDMLRGFLEPEFPLYCGDNARKIIPNVKELVEDTDERLIWVCDAHRDDDIEFNVFPKHCLRGSIEAQIIPELIGFDGNVVLKRSIDGFSGTTLQAIVSSLKPTTVTVVGVCTDICVLYVVAGLRMRGYPVTVPSNCVASFDQEMHEFGLKHMNKVLGAVIS